MDCDKVKRVLNSPCKPIVLLALELVNLKDKERLVVELVDIRGLTQERSAEQMNCTTQTVKNIRKKAYNKMCKAWENQELIKKILEEE